MRPQIFPRPRRASSKGGAIVAFALAAALSPGCECSWFAPSAKATHQVGSLEVVVKGQAHREIGLDGVGAPHVGGVVWPAVDGYGYTVRLGVGDRPTIAIVASSTPTLLTEAELSGMVGGVEIAGSGDGKHVAYREPQKDWIVLHLLPAGVPFDSDRWVVNGAAVDWASLPAPEEIALAALRDAKQEHGGRYPLLWSAVLAQPPGPPWDDGLLEAFPSSKRARAWATGRFDQKPPPSEAWREAAAKKAVAALTDRSFDKETLSTFVAVVLKADLPSERDTMDAALVEVWKDAGEIVRSGEAFRQLGARLGMCDPKPWAKRNGPPPSDGARRAMVAGARAMFEKRTDCDEAFEIAVAAGDDADRTWADDQLVAAWPDDEHPTIQTDDVHEQLVARAGGAPSSRCRQSPPPPSPAWRARVRDKARGLLSHERDAEKAAAVLVALGDQPELDAGLDFWLERFPDATGSRPLVDNATRGSAPWKARAIAKAEGVRRGAAAKLAEGYESDEERRLRAASTLLYHLEVETADCARLAELQSKWQQYDDPRPMPERCAQK